MAGTWRATIGQASVTGLDLRGWQTNAATATRWQAGGNRLALKAGPANPEAVLWTEVGFRDAEFVLDCRPGKPAEGGEAVLPAVKLRGVAGNLAEIKLTGATPGGY